MLAPRGGEQLVQKSVGVRAKECLQAGSGGLRGRVIPYSQSPGRLPKP